MSHFQYVGFRAVDTPLSAKQRDFMETQSSRAEITRWSFNNTYQYGDFRGNAEEMLRRGFDVHLHYCSYGTRKLMIRLPDGPPAPQVLLSKYLIEHSVSWKRDTTGPAGILTIAPFIEAGDLDELWELDEYLDRIVGIRQQLIDGDLRPLYAAWLCGCQGDVDPEEVQEPPVPAGLEELPDPIEALLDFYGWDAHIWKAAAQQSPPLPHAADKNASVSAWLKTLKVDELRHQLTRFLTDDPATAKRQCLQTIRRSHPLPEWPVAEGTRTCAQLQQRAAEFANAARARKANLQERLRRRRLADIAAAPQKVLDEVDRLVAQRGRETYHQAAKKLSEVREALGGEEGDNIARQHAAHLKKKHPTLRLLHSMLREQNLLS